MFRRSLLGLGLLIAQSAALPRMDQSLDVPVSKDNADQSFWCSSEVNEKHVEVHERFAAIEDRHLEKRGLEHQNSTASHINGTVPARIRIETYIHIVSSEPKNITDKRLDAQLDALREIFDPTGIAFDVKDTSYVEHKRWSKEKDKDTMLKKLRKGDYTTLNVFIVDSFQESSTLGRASLPYEGKFAEKPHDDYVMVRANTVFPHPNDADERFRKGGTLSHEIGHWLGLLHVFHDGCDGAGDHVSDTPSQLEPHFGCSEIQDTCPDAAGLDDLENIMGYGIE